VVRGVVFLTSNDWRGDNVATGMREGQEPDGDSFASIHGSDLTIGTRMDFVAPIATT